MPRTLEPDDETGSCVACRRAAFVCIFGVASGLSFRVALCQNCYCELFVEEIAQSCGEARN